ncbi:MAG TPA: hypothetical protein VGR92_00730 [Steroidobacteraceae bacterium]|nr:hypothetical protein [Steroidobacteraceae bacterium]
MVAAHSTERGGLRPAARLALILLLGAAAAPAIAARAVSTAAPTYAVPAGAHWLQIETRIESGYFQQDAAGLVALSARLSAGGGAAIGAGKGEEWRSYYAALAAYRLALLARNEVTRAWPFTQRCVAELDRTLARDSGSAEALALQSACLALQSSLDPWRSPLAAPLSRTRSDKALKLAPENPRVLLLGALAARDRPAFFGGDDQRAFVLMQRAVSAFERQSAQGGLPRWGAADAFTDLAEDYLGRGETLAARNVLERALLLAPDFTHARRLMAEIVAG